MELPEAVECLRGAFHAATCFYAFPTAHHRRIKTTNSVERLHGEIKRRTRAVGAFRDRDSALRLVAAIAIRVCARWGDRSYLDMKLLGEKEKAFRLVPFPSDFAPRPSPFGPSHSLARVYLQS